MGTVADKLALTESTKADIKAALQEKGQSPTDVFSTYGNLVRAIKTDPVLQSKTVTPSTSQQSVTPDSGYDGLDKVTVEAMPTATQATPAITVDNNGLITASAEQSAGYVAAGTKSATKQMTTQAAKTVTPGTADQTAVAAGVYTTGAVTVKGDANLDGANIVEGKSIFGKTGTAEPASALADTLTTQDDLISQIMTALEGKTAGSGGASTVSVTIKSSDNGYIYWFDKDGNYEKYLGAGASKTVDVLSGILFAYAYSASSLTLTGDYDRIQITSNYYIVRFKTDGGTADASGTSSGPS